MRTSRLAATVGLLVTLIAIAVMVVTAAVPRDIDGRGGRQATPTGPLGEDATVEPLPATPTERWRVDATAIFGESVTPEYLLVQAADDRVVVVSATPENHGPAPIGAVDPRTGRVLWKAPGLTVAKCALSRDHRLACVHNSEGHRQTTVDFLDATSGAVTATRTVPTAGYAGIVRAGNGFLVTTEDFNDAITSSTTALTWFSSDASRRWTATPPADLERPEISEAGNLVAISDYRKGARVYQLDTGTVLYDSERDRRQAAARAFDGDVTMTVAAAGNGFAMGFSMLTKDGAHDDWITLFDRLGIRKARVDDYELSLFTDATETDLIPALGRADSSSYVPGVISTSTGTVLWRGATQGNSADKVGLLPGGDVSVTTSAYPRGYQVRLYDARTGSARGAFALSTYMTARGSDGTRALYEGDLTAGERGPSAFTAFDMASGSQVWRYKVTQSADEVNVKLVGPYLFRLDARGRGPAAVTRMA